MKKKKFYYVVYNIDNNPYFGKIKAEDAEDAAILVKNLFEKQTIRFNKIYIFNKCEYTQNCPCFKY